MTYYEPRRMRFGAFIAPYHGLNENPTLALERDFQLVELLDRLDYDEAWVGEHHSAGFEIIGSPEVFIAGAAERTRRIRLGTGVNSVTYHHPMILADRLVQLDHQTRGRLMCGFGPGQLPSDAVMLGIDPAEQRDMMSDALQCIVDLLDGKQVSRDASWFKLVNAQLHVLPYQSPRMDMAVACSMTPNGPMTAGRHGLGMLSLAASLGAGFDMLPNHWELYEAQSKAHGHVASRDAWRVVVPMHLAETREAAERQVESGIDENVLTYLRGVGAPGLQDVSPKDAVRVWREQGLLTFGRILVGTPDDAIERIRSLQAQSGGFGCFLFLALNAADWVSTQRSYELFARHVMPKFQNSDRRREALEWCGTNMAKARPRIAAGIERAVARDPRRKAGDSTER